MVKKFKVELVILGFVIIVISAIYYSTFGDGVNLSQNQQEWAFFGNYFGGIVSPVMAFLAFGAALRALNLHEDQLKTSKNAVIERLIDNQSVLLDEKLNSPPRETLTNKTICETYQSLDRAIAGAVKKLPDTTIAKKIEEDLLIVRFRFDRFSYSLWKYREIGGSEDLLDFYISLNVELYTFLRKLSVDSLSSSKISVMIFDERANAFEQRNS